MKILDYFMIANGKECDQALFLFQKFQFSGVITKSVEKIKILDYFMIANGCVIATSVEKMKILDYFMIANGKECD